jgi:hypothetical protein
MAIPAELRAPLTRAASLITTNIKDQTPVDTGKLKGSIKTQIVETPDGYSFRLVSKEYVKYGRFVDRGTGPYRTTKRGKWNQRPAKGKGGIIPRFFTTVNSSTIRRVKKILSDAMDKYVAFELRRMAKKR